MKILFTREAHKYDQHSESGLCALDTDSNTYAVVQPDSRKENRGKYLVEFRSTLIKAVLQRNLTKKQAEDLVTKIHKSGADMDLTK